MYNWKFSFTKDLDLNKFTPEAEKILEVFRDAMGTKNWTAEEIITQAGDSDALGLLKDENSNVGAYLFFTTPKEKFNDKHLIWIDAISVKKSLRGNSHYENGIKQAREFSGTNYDFGYVGGRSQNPVIFFLRDRLKKDSPLFPFDGLYSQEMMEFLIKNVAEVRRPYEKFCLDVSFGICRKAYKGKLGDYDENFRKDRVDEFEEKLKNWNFDRYKGDSLIIIKQL